MYIFPDLLHTIANWLFTESNSGFCAFGNARMVQIGEQPDASSGSLDGEQVLRQRATDLVALPIERQGYVLAVGYQCKKFWSQVAGF